MSTKSTPEFRIMALPESAVTKQNDQNFGFRDVIRNLVKRDCGDNNATVPQVSSETATPPMGAMTAAPWAKQPHFEKIDASLDYIEFTGERVNEGAAAVASSPEGDSVVGGLTLKARVLPLNCEVTPQKGKPPKGLASARVFRFKQKKPKLVPSDPAIQTVKAFYQDVTSVQILAALPDKTVELESIESLEANQQTRWDIFWIGIAPGQKAKAGARFAMAGNEWSVVFRQNAENWILPTLERMIQGEWVTVRKFEAAKFKEFAGTTILTFRRMGGRLVVMLSTGDNNHAFETLLSRTSPIPSAEPEVVSAGWRQGKVNIASFGVRLRAGLSLVEYRVSEGERLYGDFSRKVKRSLKTTGAALDEITPAPSSGEAKLFPAGWQSSGTAIKRKAVLDHKGLTYTLRLLASDDGHDAPLVSHVLGKFQGNDLEGDDEPLDISASFLSGSFDAASPESQVNGNILSLRLSRSILRLIGEKHEIEWRDFVRQYRLLTFDVRWRLKDGTYSDWDSLGEHYIEDEDFDNPTANEWHLQLSCCDPSLRLRAPHSTVDYRYLHDLIFLLMEMNNGLGGELYGGDCAKYIIGVELGAEQAARLNGNGDPLRYMPEGHYPLISTRNGGAGYIQVGGGDTGPPTFNGPVLPPPRWNCSAQDWLSKIGESDFAVPFYAPVPGGDGRPCPIYANLDEWLKGVPIWTFADDDYDPGDLDFIIKSMKSLRRGNANYNAAQALWNAQGAAGQKMPFQATRVAEGRVPANDPNSEEHSWRRTYVQDRVVWWEPEATRAWVQEFLGGLAGVDIRWPSIVLSRGDARIWWGHKAFIKSHNVGSGGKFSDPDLGLEDIEFRIIKVRHDMVRDKVGPNMMVTTLDLFPMLNNEE